MKLFRVLVEFTGVLTLVCALILLLTLLCAGFSLLVLLTLLLSPLILLEACIRRNFERSK